MNTIIKTQYSYGIAIPEEVTLSILQKIRIVQEKNGGWVETDKDLNITFAEVLPLLSEDNNDH